MKIRLAIGIWVCALGALVRLSGQQPQLPPRDAEVKHMFFRLEMNQLQPSSVSVEEGWWMVRVMNGVVTDELDIRLDNEASVTIGNKKAPARTAKTAMLVNLRPGKHVLRIPGNAGWRAEIQVQPKRP